MEEISLRKKIVQSELTYDYLKDEVHILYEEKNELQQRIDKAIERINNWLEGVNNEDIIIVMDNLENILKGDYDESNISQL